MNANHWERVRNEFLNYVAKAPSLPEEGPRRDERKTPESHKSPELSPRLSDKAKKLLLETSKLKSGVFPVPILRDEKDPRERAGWEAALEELEQGGFLKPANVDKNAYKITQAGYEAAELLNRENEP